ncbi:MAG: guanylate kinase [Desulfomonile tiedjei]|uniref:Guanylate kinase n=1 Tax=Desulfomonile tiedjei TaxID=2358 RepID=A0A9D6Z244_9BACT|nr:guanylate kinase [Desulfomonile tiedjei]
MAKGALYVISAPSGAGKSTLINRIRPMFPDMLYSISCTTRSPRKDEAQGVDYFFVSREQFKSMIKNNEFLEWKEVHGNLYGTPAAFVSEAVDSGRSVILDIDVEGAREVFSKFKGAVGIFITVPNMAVLEERLRSRGTDSEASIRIRMINAGHEMELAPVFRYQVVNDRLDNAVEELASILNEQTSRCWK